MASGNSLEEAPITLSMNVDEPGVKTILGATEQVSVPRVVKSQNILKIIPRKVTVQTYLVSRPRERRCPTAGTDNGQFQSLETASGMVLEQTTPATTATEATLDPAARTPDEQRQIEDNTKEKCRKFFVNLLALCNREPKSVECNVRALIQQLIDTEVEPEEFSVRLERLMDASPQPCLIGFLKKSLPLLRQSLVTGESVIDGIRPPPANVDLSIASSPIVSQDQVTPP